MKRLYSVLTATILFVAVIPAATAAVEVSVDFFHDHLESYGDWREVGDYGYCWQPRDVDRNWRPYSDGHWLYTDAGWTWDSEEPYGWAVYHYGRWARVAQVGWVWVPGTEWGPAWVSWRRSPRHVGWAPLPPDAQFRHSIGFSNRVDADYDIGPTNYSFVEVRNFGAPRLRTVIIEPRENITIIRQTTNITNITYVNNVVYNEGPQYDVISRESAQPIRRLKLERREQLDGDPGTLRAEQLRSRVEGDSFRVIALPFDTQPATAPRKVAAKVEKVEVDHGWKDAGPPAVVEKLRAQIKSEPAAPAGRPPQPPPEKTAEVPAVAPGTPPVPEEKPAKGKMRSVGEPTTPAAPVTTEVAPPSPDKPVAPNNPEKIAKPSKDAKPEKPDATAVRPTPPAVEEAAPSSQSKKGKNQGVEVPRPPVQAPIEAPAPVRKKENIEPTRTLPPATDETAPSGQSKKGKNKGIDAPRAPAEAPLEAPAPMRKKESIEPTRNQPPPADETPRQKNPGKGDALPKPEPPAARSVERIIPNNPEPRPEAKKPEPHPQAAPAAAQPPPPAKDKGKGKGKDEKKDDGKPDGAPQ